MSSFVIDKAEYIKAAGLMYGIESARNHSHKYFLDNVKSWFERAYELNVASVNEQYNDNWPTDKDDYYSTFQTYCKKGECIWINHVIGCVGFDGNFTEVRKHLMEFFNSSLYQIENEEMSREVKSIFYDCIGKLFKDSSDSDDCWWGRIEC